MFVFFHSKAYGMNDKYRKQYHLSYILIKYLNNTMEPDL